MSYTKNTTCRNHPDRKARCKGLCRQCYWRFRYYTCPSPSMMPEYRRKHVKPEWYQKKKQRIATDPEYKRRILETARLSGKRRRKENPEAYTERQRRNYRKSVYGITEEQYNLQLKAQDGKCLLCREQRRLCVDHDHKTGKIRGLICHRCNTMLGFIERKGED